MRRIFFYYKFIITLLVLLIQNTIASQIPEKEIASEGSSWWPYWLFGGNASKRNSEPMIFERQVPNASSSLSEEEGKAKMTQNIKSIKIDENYYCDNPQRIEPIQAHQEEFTQKGEEPLEKNTSDERSPEEEGQMSNMNSEIPCEKTKEDEEERIEETPLVSKESSEENKAVEVGSSQEEGQEAATKETLPPSGESLVALLPESGSEETKGVDAIPGNPDVEGLSEQAGNPAKAEEVPLLEKKSLGTRFLEFVYRNGSKIVMASVYTTAFAFLIIGMTR